jgi:hypothetical protein
MRRKLVMNITLVCALPLVSLLTTGCTTTGTTAIQTPTRITYETGEAGRVDRVEECDPRGVCRRMLYYTETGTPELLQERDAKGVCRRATYYDAQGRISRIETHDAKGISQNVIRFSKDGSISNPANPKKAMPQTDKGGQP